jgi:hypothetical protein
MDEMVFNVLAYVVGPFVGAVVGSWIGVYLAGRFL